MSRGGNQRPLRALIDRGDGTLGVVLSDGNVAIVDAEVRDIVEPYNWSSRAADGIVYAMRRSKAEGTVYLHRWLLALTPDDDVEVDHINSDTLDCRRSNLRIATRTENARHIRSHRGSSSIFVGVSWHGASGKWRVGVGSQHLGLYDSEIEAARARDEAARDLFGEWPVLNLPPCPACGWPAPDHALDCPDHYRLPH
jgi:hypothetical protein